MHKFESNEDSTVTEAEMHELVRRLNQVKTSPQISDVAEALGVSEDQVKAMLTDIRQKAAPTASLVEHDSTKSLSQVRRGPRWYVILLPAVFLMLTMLLFKSLLARPAELPPPVPIKEPATTTMKGVPETWAVPAPSSSN